GKYARSGRTLRCGLPVTGGRGSLSVKPHKRKSVVLDRSDATLPPASELLVGTEGADERTASVAKLADQVRRLPIGHGGESLGAHDAIDASAHDPLQVLDGTRR